MRDRVQGWAQSSDLRIWLGTFAVVLVLAVCWALASPRYAGPDEPSHTVRAYSVAHGEVFGEPREAAGQPGTVVEAPRIYSESNPACFAFQPMATGDCLTIAAGEEVVETPTSAGRHPPLYYGIVGLPTWFNSGGSSFYLMRGVNAALCAAVLASAMVTARRPRWSSWLPAGVILSCTPMVFFLFGLVNPNAVEVAAAIGAWVGGLALIGEDEVDRRVLLRFAVAVVLLALTRQLGVLWVAMIGVSLLVLAGWPRVKRLLADRAVQVMLAVAVVSGIGAVLWVRLARTLDAANSGAPPLTVPQSDIQRALVGEIGLLFREWVGVFGWQDTRVPEATYFLWAIALGAVVLAVLAGPSRRVGIVVMALVAGIFVVPAAMQYPGVRDADLFWQGRYTLPLVVGIPLVATWGLASARRRVVAPGSLAVPVVGLGLFVAHMLAFGQNLRRYTVGADGTIWFFTSERWTPPVPTVILLVVYAAAVVAWLALGRPRPAVDPSPEGEQVDAELLSLSPPASDR